MKTKLYAKAGYSSIAVDLSLISTIIDVNGYTKLYAAGETDAECIEIPFPFDAVYADWVKAKGDEPNTPDADLLAACEIALQYHQGYHSSVGRTLREAIAKAKGKAHASKDDHT